MKFSLSVVVNTFGVKQRYIRLRELPLFQRDFVSFNPL